MAAKLGFEAIEYILKKTLTKKGVKGITTIPGKAYNMRMKQLVDEMANKMRNMGYDINKVTQKEVQGLLDSAEAIAKQEARTANAFFADALPRPSKVPKKSADVHPFQGFTPKIVPKETEAQIKARMIKQNRSNVQKSYLRQLDKKIMDEMDITAKEMDNMSSTALDDLRRNADPIGMEQNLGEITPGRGVGDFADDPNFLKDAALSIK